MGAQAGEESGQLPEQRLVVNSATLPLHSRLTPKVRPTNETT